MSEREPQETTLLGSHQRAFLAEPLDFVQMATSMNSAAHLHTGSESFEAIARTHNPFGVGQGSAVVENGCQYFLKKRCQATEA